MSHLLLARPHRLLERKKQQRSRVFLRLNFDVYADMDNRERASGRDKNKEEQHENFTVSVRK